MIEERSPRNDGKSYRARFLPSTLTASFAILLARTLSAAVCIEHSRHKQAIPFGTSDGPATGVVRKLRKEGKGL